MDKSVKVKNNNEFVCGYMCALASIVQGHGMTSIIEEAFSCQSMTIGQLRADGVDEHDIELLKPCIKEVERKDKIFNERFLK